ncbi:hypothetical protein LTS18_010599, partial [Coniosporium uncinatum]
MPPNTEASALMAQSETNIQQEELARRFEVSVTIHDNDSHTNTHTNDGVDTGPLFSATTTPSSNQLPASSPADSAEKDRDVSKRKRRTYSSSTTTSPPRPAPSRTATAVRSGDTTLQVADNAPLQPPLHA